MNMQGHGSGPSYSCCSTEPPIYDAAVSFIVFSECCMYVFQLRTLSQLIICRPPPTPPPLKSCHIDIKKMRNVPKIKMEVTFHITSYRVWALRASNRGSLVAQKFNFFSKLAKNSYSKIWPKCISQNSPR